MTDEVIIRVENLEKKYSLRHQGDGRYTALRDVIAEKARRLFRRPNNLVSNNGSPARATREDFWAPKDVSFEVRRGKVAFACEKLLRQHAMPDLPLNGERTNLWTR